MYSVEGLEVVESIGEEWRWEPGIYTWSNGRWVSGVQHYQQPENLSHAPLEGGEGEEPAKENRTRKINKLKQEDWDLQDRNSTKYGIYMCVSKL